MVYTHGDGSGDEGNGLKEKMAVHGRRAQRELERKRSLLADATGEKRGKSRGGNEMSA